MASTTKQLNVDSMAMNSNQLSMKSVTDFPMNKNDAIEMSKRISNIIENGTVDGDTLVSTFPGFLKENFQGEIVTNNYFNVYTTSPYANKQTLKFRVKPNTSDQMIIPSCIQLVAPIKFTDDKGDVFKFVKETGIANSDFLNLMPKPNFWGRLFKQITVKHQSTQLSKTQGYAALESKIQLDRINPAQQQLFSELLMTSQRKYPSKDKRNFKKSEQEQDKWQEAFSNLCGSMLAEPNGYSYNIPLAFYCNFFKAEAPIPADYEFDVEINLEQNMKVLFDDYVGMADSATQADADALNIAKWDFVEAPYLRVGYITYTVPAKDTYRTILSKLRSYRLNRCIEYYTHVESSVKGTSMLNTTLPHSGVKHEHIIFSMFDTKTFEASTMFTNTFLEQANKFVKSIEIDGFSHMGNQIVYKLDLDQHDDKRTIYNWYVSYLCGGTFNQNNVYSQRDNNIKIRIPSFEEYWNARLKNSVESLPDGRPQGKSTEGFPIVFDLRAAGGYTNKQEPALGADDIRIRINLRAPLGVEYKWVFNMGSYSEWNVIQPNEGGVEIAYTNNAGNANFFRNRI